MHRYRLFVHVCVFILIVAVSFDYTYNPFESNETVTFSDAVNDVTKMEDSLYDEIRTKSENYEEAPQNAVIDKVWKKMPGRNGVKVNVDKSYEQMKKNEVFDETLLVYEQIPPEITREDLPAAPIYRGHPDKDMVALLINVSWGTEHIPVILNILKEHNVKATFFIEGKWAMENTDYVKMIHEQEHVIGNHAYNHPVMSRLARQDMIEQISQTNEILEAITGETPKWFAPPSGDYNDQVVETADEQNMETILWSVDTIDWKNPSVSVMMNRVNNNIHPGATLLMHPTSSIVEGLDSLIKSIKEKGYKIGTVDTLLSAER
ncbi:probable sporulation protein, polysaccharide deacetylase family [Lentibacillus halodurans]|uniref:Probable sporulation protein, polysaccharide deacetylase family n=1 Tax=Lentibacillus halodurans TaxID=237679 RepID=A0A1I0VKJ1_9BACI|nr:polysaccharide deacetylase family protein [Lentibacillus halodurans]SFA76842.1 probable sporulation protein, polysaccharide deacetylase family [Lentibacillus halodurans]